MLTSFASWWLSRMTEMLPTAWTNRAAWRQDGIVVDVASCGSTPIVSIRRGGHQEPTSLSAAARLTGRKPVLLHPSTDTVLVKHHTVPTAPRRQLDQLLRHELGRITPFTADELFWRWDGYSQLRGGSRTNVILTMVPKLALVEALDVLEKVGLKANFVEVGSVDQRRLLPIGDAFDLSSGIVLIRGLKWACAGLAVVALVLPFVLQALALHATETAIAELQPSISQVAALRRDITAGDAGQDILAKESGQTGDALQTLATITRILPDDTFLTDFVLRERKMTLSGRSASAARLITSLSADPVIQNTAFVAPVTRIEGAASDVFSIKAEIAK